MAMRILLNALTLLAFGHQGTVSVAGLDISGTRVAMSASMVRELIAEAYGLKDYQVAGGAPLLNSADRYDIAGKNPAAPLPLGMKPKNGRENYATFPWSADEIQIRLTSS